jgi:hypothetical protein
MPYDIDPLFVLLLVVAVVPIGLWLHFTVIVRLRGGVPRVLKGKVSRAFLDAVAQVCRETNIRRGWLGGVRRRKRIELVFSWHFPAPIRQRLRNLWQLHQ